MQPVPTRRRRRILTWVASILGGFVLLVAVVAAWESWRLRRWAGDVGPPTAAYAHPLMAQGQTVDGLSAIDQEIVHAIGAERHVLDMTRSDLFRPVVARECMAKVHLVTVARPGTGEVRVPIKLFVRLRRESGDWRVAEVRELALP